MQLAPPQVAEVDLRREASRRAAHEQPPARGQRAQARIERVASGEVDGDVDALTTAQPPGGAAEVFSRIVDDFIGAELAQLGRLLDRAGCSDDSRAYHLGNLHTGRTDTAAGAEDEDAFASHEAADGRQHSQRGAEVDRNRRAHLECNAVWQADQIVRRHGDALGESPVHCL